MQIKQKRQESLKQALLFYSILPKQDKKLPAMTKYCPNV